MFDGTRPKKTVFFLPRSFQPSRSVKHGLAKLLLSYFTTRDRPLLQPHGPGPEGSTVHEIPNHWISPTLYISKAHINSWYAHFAHLSYISMNIQSGTKLNNNWVFTETQWSTPYNLHPIPCPPKMSQEFWLFCSNSYHDSLFLFVFLFSNN